SDDAMLRAERTAARPAMPQQMPAVSLVAVPGRRKATIEIAKELERRGFAGIYSPSPFGNMALCEAIALNTQRIPFGTSVSPIYAGRVEVSARGAGSIQELWGGRSRFGVGVSPGPSHIRLGVTPGKPLAETRAFVQKYRAHENLGALPPVTLATLRVKMIA